MSDVKLMRGQLRQIAKELLPELLNAEQYQALKRDVDVKISALEKHVKEAMHNMNESHKKTMDYVMRQVLQAEVKTIKKD